MNARREIRQHGGRREGGEKTRRETRKEPLLPLYRFEGALPKECGDGNLGLWFDKFFDRWRLLEPSAQQEERQQGRQQQQERFRRSEGTEAASAIPSWTTQATRDDNPKLEWLTKLAQGGTPVGWEDLLRESAVRMVRLVEAHGGRWRVFRTTSRFVTGLGRRHPVENGFAWHSTLGVPYLPGSSVKGMVRAWTRLVAPEDGERMRRLFGRDADERSEGGQESQQGAVAFLDAIPCRPPRLAVDVMTPHYANWTEDDPPGDWRSPVPVFFLTTEQGARFLFGVIPAGNVSGEDLDRVMDWLAGALDWAGAGAKTAAGYGRMAPDKAVEAELRKQAGV